MVFRSMSGKRSCKFSDRNTHHYYRLFARSFILIANVTLIFIRHAKVLGIFNTKTIFYIITFVLYVFLFDYSCFFLSRLSKNLQSVNQLITIFSFFFFKFISSDVMEPESEEKERKRIILLG